MRHGDDHVLALDQVLVLDAGIPVEDLGPARGGVFGPDFRQLVLDDAHDAGARAQDVEVVGDLVGQPLQLVADLVAAERGQALQPQVEDGAGLGLGQAVGAVLAEPMARIVDQCDQRRDVLGRPVAGHQGLAGRVRIRRGPDQPDHLVDVGDRDGETAQDVGPLARLVQEELGAAGDDLLAEVDEGLDQVLEVQKLGPAAVERHHVAAEARLQRRVAVELVQNHVGDGVALQLDHDAHAVTVGFVAEIRDAFDALLAHQIGDLLDQRGLVHLIRDLGEDQGLALLAQFLDVGLRPHDDRAAAGHVGRAGARAPEDRAAGREVRARDDVVQALDGDRRIVDQRDAAVDHLAEVVRRDVGRHADRDAAGAVDEEVGEAGGQDRRLVLRLVVVRVEVDRVLVDVLEEGHRGLRQARFGVAHRGRRIAVDRAEIALAVDQHQPHGEILRHADEGVVDRLVAVRVILTHHVADDARRLHVLAVRQVAVLVHGVQDAAMHRLQAVARIRQGPADDHAHRVGQVGLAHLVGDRDGLDVGRGRGAPVGSFSAKVCLSSRPARAHTLLPDGLADLRHRHQCEARKAKQISILDGCSGDVPQARRTPVDECPAKSLEIGKGCGLRQSRPLREAADGRRDLP